MITFSQFFNSLILRVTRERPSLTLSLSVSLTDQVKCHNKIPLPQTQYDF